jgi:hypothetical protein
MTKKDTMAKGLIRLCYAKVIDASSVTAWDKYVFEATYKEFYMQAQQFDQQKKYTTFQEILENIPKADQMHYLVSTAAVGYIRQLNETIPDIANAFGKPCVPFKNFRFEIIQSHVKNRSLHKVAIYFYSENLTWIDTIGDRLLFSFGNHLEALAQGQSVETEMLTIRPNLIICSYQEMIPS